LKRIPLPFLVKMRMSFWPLVVRTETSSSSSASLMATRVWLRESYSLNSVFLAWPFLGHHHQVAAGLVVTGVDDRLDGLLGPEGQDRLGEHPLGGARLAGDGVGLDPMDQALVGEEPSR
jgi:hypothetical protein